jgi:hypothetical protein
MFYLCSMFQAGPTSASEDDVVDEDDSAEEIRRQRALFRELTDIGMELARAVRVQVAAHGLAEPPDPRPEAPVSPSDGGSAVAVLVDLGLVFSRVSRAVRLTLALETRIVCELSAQANESAAQRAAPQPYGGQTLEDIEKTRRQLARLKARANTVMQVVEATFEAEGRDRDLAMDMLDGLRSRLHDDRAYGGHLNGGYGKAIARVCKDLGVSPDWERWRRDDWPDNDPAGAPPSPDYMAHGFGREVGTVAIRRGGGQSP